MPELDFRVERAHASELSAAPSVVLTLLLRNRPADVAIQAVALRVQVRIEPTRRTYDRGEEERLQELFGAPSLWARTLKTLLWANVPLNVPGFVGATSVELALPCTFDLDLAAAKYLFGVQQGEVPLTLLFSGTVFHAGADGLQVAPIPWTSEVAFRLDVATWRRALDLHYPQSAALQIGRDVFERLYRYRRARGLASWDAAIEGLLATAEAASARS
jgi:hypothetical protein